MANNRTCKVCGTKYNYCPTCKNDITKPSWMNMFCSSNCYNIFMTLSNLFNKKITEDIARKEIIRFDTNRVINDTMNKQIQKLLKTSIIENKVKGCVVDEKNKRSDEMVQTNNTEIKNQDTSKEERTVLAMAKDNVKPLNTINSKPLGAGEVSEKETMVMQNV